jgi:archaellum component FlaC
MEGDLLAASLGILGFVLGLAFQWGNQKATVNKIQEELGRLDKAIDSIETAINSLHKEYVSHRQFDLVISEIKDTIRSMERDIKEILRQLSHTDRNL